MKKLMTLGMALVLTTALAGSALASSIAGKVWYAEMEAIDDSTPMYGATASLSIGESVWISGMYLMGTYEDVPFLILEDGVYPLDVDTADAEVLMGISFEVLDIGIGARYSEWVIIGPDPISDLTEMAIFGPMAYIGLGDSFDDSPLGWYVGGSYMFKDFGDAEDEDVDGFEHYNVEGGLFLALDPVTATVGYRMKEYVEHDDSVFKGVAASLGFGF